jgi:hypothetical protein
MVRYLLAVAGVVALMSGSAFAETGDMGTKKVITRTSPDGMAQKKVIIKRHADGLVSKKIIRHEGYGSSMPERRIVREREIIR